ncbi:hypothetical protein FOPG_18351 [Fusarium oxysporum f. sp. conglutinans race 2 54008]|uniref:Uncharacterized protein n=1 Tax=Fusarium oxysporum f. sp. conglutinans race 2 54008 TaxID=1089457 RepID=X0GQ36_FUSOX|nr:hypothetical protein FOPG_18351 [Fusarium oxysporum f. sp. conglutinans race 2 54008]
MSKKFHRRGRNKASGPILKRQSPKTIRHVSKSIKHHKPDLSLYLPRPPKIQFLSMLKQHSIC